MYPAVRMMRSVEKEDRDQHEGGEAQQRKDDCRVHQTAVIDAHSRQHRDKARDGPS